MSVQWYFRKGGAVYGPLTAKALYLLAESGELRPTDEVLRDDLDKWFPATKVKGLKFRDAGTLAPPPLPSQADRPKLKDRPVQPVVAASVSPAVTRGPLDDLFDDSDDELVEVLESTEDLPQPQVIQRLKDSQQRNVLLLSDGTWRYAEGHADVAPLAAVNAESASPDANALINPRQEYYRVYTPRFTYREFLYENIWLSPIILVIATFIKLFRIQTSPSCDDPPLRSIRLCEIRKNQFPEYFRERLDPWVEKFQSLGFQPAVEHLIEDPLHQTTSGWMTFFQPEGKSFGRVQSRQFRGNARQDQGTNPCFVTEFRDGTYLISTSGKANMLSPPTCTINCQRGKKFDRLWESHEKVLREKCGDRLIRVHRTPAEVREATERLHQSYTDFHLNRGVFKPLDAKDLKKFEESSQKIVRARSSGLQNPEVIAELEKLQEEKPGWIKAILLLVISAAFFLGVGAAQWSWRFALMLIPILFIHELGHYLTMMMFGYKNLKMFFIPFFGAAVSGRHYNVAGWKKVIVSLAGPLPGIYLAIGLGIYGLYHKHEFSMEIAFLALILNGFNLIPVLPLDGGWVMHAVLFCRHPLLDTAFRVVAGIGLILLGIVSGGQIMTGVAVAMFISLPTTYLVARITDRMRKEGGVVISPDARSVPNEVADKIITELRLGKIQNMNNKQLAQFTLQVFEGVNATPPNWLASLFFLAVHFGTFLIAAVFSIILVLGQKGDLGNLVIAAATQPETPYVCGSLQTWEGPAYDSVSVKQESTLVAPFDDAGPAEQNFKTLQGSLPPTTRMTLFGSTLLIQFPPSEKEPLRKFFSDLEKTCGKEVFICQPNVPLNVSLTCLTNSLEKAEELEADLAPILGPFNVNHARLIPPWYKNDQRTMEEKAKHRLARETYIKLVSGDQVSAPDPGLEKLLESVRSARRRGDEEEARQISEQINELQQQGRQKQIDAIRNLGPQNVSLELISAYEGWLAANDESNKLRIAEFKAAAGKSVTRERLKEIRQPAEAKQQEMFQLMGQLPPPNENGENQDLPFEIKAGHMSRAVTVLSFNFLSIPEGATGLPAFAEWLCSMGCNQVTYEVGQGFNFDFDQDEEEMSEEEMLDEEMSEEELTE